MSSKTAESLRLSRLKLEKSRVLGTGAGSTIYLVIDTASARKYALKHVVRSSADEDIYVNQAQHEFEVAKMLSHPGLLRIYDCRVLRSWFRVTGVELLMEYVDGRVLDDLKHHRTGQFVLVFERVAEAMVHMHRRGVYHGDLKPSNIMVSRSGAVKVIDFGTAWIKGEDKGRVQGTPHYMAPEQGRLRVVDERTDIYNLGATMYRIFTGEYANLGIPSLENGRLGRSRLQSPASLNAEVSRPLSDLIMECLAARPEKRPAGMFVIQQRLEEVIESMNMSGVAMLGSEGEV